MLVKKQLSDSEHQRVVKLLALTSSTNDAEALAAIRAANRILDKKNLTWPEIVTNGLDTSALLAHLLSKNW